MKHYNDFSDSRHNNGCIFCSKQPDSREHIPARTFLNKPYPANLHVLPVCKTCNNKLSLDEEYVSFLVCYLKNLESSNLDEYLDRFTHVDELETRILRGLKSDETDKDSIATISLETERIKNVLNKYAFAHFCFERGEHPDGEATHVNFAFLNQMSDEQINLFNKISCGGIWPEVGSRLLQRIAANGDSWMVVQDGEYRYYVSPNEPYVRIAIKEFLFAEIIFNEI